MPSLFCPTPIAAAPPPLEELPNESDPVTVVQADYSAVLASSARFSTPEASFAAFAVPDRAILKPGKHTVCYAPALASEMKVVDDLKNSNFHYAAGELEIGESLFHCDFEEPVADGAFEQSDAADAVLPCGFRNYLNRWQANLVWQLGAGATETTATGPQKDASPDGSGHYIFMDSPGYALGAAATILSPPLAFPAGGYCVQFKYSMFGQDVSTLRVYTHGVRLNPRNGEAGSTDTQHLGNWGSPRWVAVGNKGTEWHEGGFEFEATEDIETHQLVFEALAGKSELGDIAIDDVKVHPGRCPPEVHHHLPKTLGLSNRPLVCGQVRLITGAHSADKSWMVEGAVSCSGRGYSLDHLNRTAWLPCCVPHVGTYKLTLQDHFGDGWTGSRLEFMFFDRVIKFGDDEFQKAGFDKSYQLAIGTFEVATVHKIGSTAVMVDVRLSRPQSHAWCGVVQAGKSGKVLKADLTPALLKRYGVRSAEPSSSANEVVHIKIDKVLKPNAAYDLYCHSEVVGEDRSDVEADELKREIGASRFRFTTDNDPPVLSGLSISATFNTITVDFTVNEAASVQCVAVKSEAENPLFGPLGPLEGVKDSKRVAEYFLSHGEGMDIAEDAPGVAVSQRIVIPGLIPNSPYTVYCYAEDVAAPLPNSLSIEAVKATAKHIRTAMKVPTIRIVRRQTLHRGFRVFVTGDAPGKAWCAAAPSDYGVPQVAEIVRVGATADLKDPGKEVPIEVRGVESNSAYVIYCVGGGVNDGVMEYSDEMANASLVSYGKYCEQKEVDNTLRTVPDNTPFHPITAEEEIRVRSFVMGVPELSLEGVYRITLLPNKTAIKMFFDGTGPRPARYARVRAGRCVKNVGMYEQLRVGPLDNPNASLGYERVTQPVETECGGYNPQGVFGRRLGAADRLVEWLKLSTGYDVGNCPTDKPRRQHVHDETCIEFGPVVVEEVCSGSESVACSTDQRGGRVWLGLKTPRGDQLPIYFIYALPFTSVRGDGKSESADQWIKRIIREQHIHPEFHEFWEISHLWVDGKVHDSIEAFLASHDSVVDFSAQAMAQRSRAKTEKFIEAGRQERRRLESASRRDLQPQPYMGAAGTAGPIPLREKRRGGLETRAHPEHVEAQGSRFEVDTSTDDEEFTISFAGWRMTATNDRDTALRIYNIVFQNQAVAFEMGLMEALAHYSVSERNWFFLDSWYGGLGAAARKVHKGIECPKTAQSLFWDGSLCVFEQDMARPLRSHWRNGEIRDGAPHTSLVLRQMITVSNYDYVTDYRFHPTGVYEASVSFTGELYAGIEVPWFSARQKDYGVQVTGAMRFAALHTHMAVWKVDVDVGPADRWKRNSVFLTEIIPDPLRPGANKMKKSFAETEREATYFRNDTRALVYEVVDEKLNLFGNLGGWRVIAFPGINPLHHDFELYSGPAAWAKYRILATVRKEGEMDSTLPRDNKYAKRPATSVDRYVEDDEPIRNEDVVVWISDGIFHVPVTEDMPLTIPVGNTLGWMIKPSNLFMEDASMDLWNSMGGGVEDPGTCAVMRLAIGDVEPVLEDTWARHAYNQRD